MKSRLIALLTAGVLIATWAWHGTRAAPAVGSVIPGQYIVVFKDSVTSPRAEARDLSVKHSAGIRFVYERAVKGFSATISTSKLDALRADPRVKFVVPDRVVGISGTVGAQVPTRTPKASPGPTATPGGPTPTPRSKRSPTATPTPPPAGQTLPTGINRIEGDLSSQLSGNGAGSVSTPAVAIIDTGIDLTHPDLNVLGGVNCSSGSSFADQNGHGSHVSGTVAAKDNNIGVVGMAPGAPLYAVRVLDASGFGSTSSVVCGIDWVTANAASLNIKVANGSYGGGGSDDGNCGNTNLDVEHMAVCNMVAAGVTFVVAAGNSNADMATSTPASYNEVLTVTALADFNGQPGGGAAQTCGSPDVDDTAADFSNWTTIGSSDVVHTIAAPGKCIFSTWLGGGYNTISGTSMATPHVTGTVALCISSGVCAGLTPAQIIAKLRADAAARPASYGFTNDPNSPLGNRYYGYLVYAGSY